jgi:hypothetical protein
MLVGKETEIQVTWLPVEKENKAIWLLVEKETGYLIAF